MIYIYNDYGGTHTTSLAAAYHLKQLPQSEKKLTTKEILNVKYFNKLTKEDFGKLIFHGIDEDGNFVYSIGRKRNELVVKALKELTVLLEDKHHFKEKIVFSNTATLADSPLGARIDAIQRAAFVAPQTGALGLIPTAHAVYSEPFHLATQLATIDFASYGRAGWIVGVDQDPRIAVAYGRDAVGPEHAAATATDFIEVARRLWDSWEDDAVIRDTATWRYFDRDKLHYADFEGDSFSVKGPSIIPRPPQGQLPVFTDASSGVVGDVALVASSAEATVSAVRDAGATLVWLELEVALDRAGLTGAERVERLDATETWAREGFGRYVGDAAGLVDLIGELAGSFDGIRLHPAVLDEDLEELGRAVLPELRRRGLHTPPVVGSTLRESIGLPASVNRYASKANA